MTYKDPTQPIERRVDDLIAGMTVEEKVAQLASSYLDKVTDSGEFSETKMAQAVENLGIGLLHSFQWGVNDNALCSRWKRRTRRSAIYIEETRLGIPAILTGEGVHGPPLHPARRSFPHAIALASSFDTRTGRERWRRLSRRRRATAGVAQILSPVLDLLASTSMGPG